MGKKRSGGAVSRKEALEFADLRELCRHLYGERDMEGIAKRLLRSTDCGRRFMEHAKAIRPSLDLDGEGLVEELFLTYDADDLLDRLLANPACGSDQEFMIWDQYWKFPPGEDPLYGIMRELAIRRARTGNLKQFTLERIRTVRRVIEREQELENYAEQRNAATSAEIAEKVKRIPREIRFEEQPESVGGQDEPPFPSPSPIEKEVTSHLTFIAMGDDKEKEVARYLVKNTAIGRGILKVAHALRPSLDIKSDHFDPDEVFLTSNAEYYLKFLIRYEEFGTRTDLFAWHICLNFPTGDDPWYGAMIEIAQHWERQKSFSASERKRIKIVRRYLEQELAFEKYASKRDFLERERSRDKNNVRER